MTKAEEAYNNYKNSVQMAKEQLVKDYEEVLKSIGMYNTTVIHKNNGNLGKFKVVIPRTPWKDPEIQFFKCLSNDELSRLHIGNIPRENTEDYILELYRVWNPKNKK